PSSSRRPTPASATRWARRCGRTRCGTAPASPVTSTAPSAPTRPAESAMPDPTRVAVFGGVYNNYLSLEVALASARRQGVDAVYCLGDLGAFGPYPDRVFPLLRDSGVLCIQGNYDNSVGNGLADCQCGYTDPRDNHFARISYEYTFRNTGAENRAWMKDL